MAGFQNRKSTAPPPPPLSQLWQMQTNPPSYSTSDTEARSLSAQDIMNDEEMNKMLAMNGHLPIHTNNNNNTHNRQRSISKQYQIPKPPLHATQAVIHEKKNNHFDEIIKNNPYKSKIKRIHTKKKRIIRPVNAALKNTNNSHTNTNTNTNKSRTSYYKNKNGHGTFYNHTITNMNHHRKESKTIDVFLRNRMSEKELQKRQILPSQFWDEKEKEREKIKTKLTKRLSKSFRPQQEELYDRGIYVTDPKEPEHAAWNHANARRHNFRSLASKFNRRPPPTEVLNRGYIQADDFRELFDDKYTPQTQPPTPTFPPNIIKKNSLDTTDIAKLNVKIKQRPSIKELRRRGLMIDDPSVPAALQNRKRELHRRRASRKLEEFLLKRPKAETLKRRHIMISVRERDEEEKSQQGIKRKLVSYMNRDKRRKKKGKIWIAQGKLLQSKRRESIKISDFLLRRPKADKLVDRHILPSMPYQGGYDEIRNDFTKDLKQKQRIIDKLFSKTSRADFNELERRGYLPPEFVSSNHINHDFDKAQFEYKRRRKQSRTDLEKQLIKRPPMKQLIHNHIIDPNEVIADDMNTYHKRRKSQKLDFKNNLNAKFQSRPDIDHVPYKYFMPPDINRNDNDDEKVIDPTSLNLDLDKHKKNNTNKRGVKRKRIEKTAKSRASLVLEQFLPVRPEIQQLWDKNILPSLPPSPHKMSSFNYKKANLNKKTINPSAISPLFGFDTTTQTPSPVQQAHAHFKHNKDGDTSSTYSPITPQTLYIDKRQKRRQDSMAQLELKLLDRAPRESLFELGILIMSPAPSPPSLSIIQQIKDEPDFKSIFESENINNNNNVPGMNSNHGQQSRKKRKLMNGKNLIKKRGNSLVLDEYLGGNVAQKLDLHLYNRPDPSELIARGIVPQYSFTKKSVYSTPSAFAKHRRNMTLELKDKLENKLRARPLLNDLPGKILAVNDIICDENMNINEEKKSEIETLLNSMRSTHEKDLEALKERYWSLLVEEKDKYKQLEMITNKREINLRSKFEEMSAECQSLSTLLIVKNTQFAQQEIEFKQRLIRLQQQHEQQYLREQDLISKKDVGNNNRKFNEQAERVKQTLVDEINKMEIQHQWKLHNLEDQIQLLKEENRNVTQFSEIEIKKLKQKLTSEIDKERNIATIMVEDLDEEKTRLVREMDEMKINYEKKIKIQKEQIQQLRQVAQEAVFYGQKAVDSKSHSHSRSLSHVDNAKYIKLKKSKENLEKKVLFLTQQILNTFKHNLNHDILKKLNLENLND